HTRSKRDWSSDVCSSDLETHGAASSAPHRRRLHRRSHRSHPGPPVAAVASQTHRPRHRRRRDHARRCRLVLAGARAGEGERERWGARRPRQGQRLRPRRRWRDPARRSVLVAAACRVAPLPRVRTGELEVSVLEQFPTAAEAAVHYAGPRTLKIEITDRTPVLAVEGASGYRLYDGQAVDLGVVDEAPKNLTVLGSDDEPDRATVAAVVRFMGSLRPELREQLSTIEAEDKNSLQ